MQSQTLTRAASRAAPDTWPVYPAVIVFAVLALAGIVTTQVSVAVPAPFSQLIFYAGLWFAVSGALGAAIWAIFGRTIFRD